MLAQMYLEKQTLLITAALIRVPDMLGGEGWKSFQSYAKRVPDTDMPGFLAGHRSNLRATKNILTMSNSAFSRLPAPLNTARGCMEMSAFLTFSSWAYHLKEADALAKDLNTIYSKKKMGDQRELIKELQKQIEYMVMHPRVLGPDQSLLSSKDQIPFEASLNIFLRLCKARHNSPDFDIVLEHPRFIWIEGKNEEKELAKSNPNERGKWIVTQNSLMESVALAERLLPEFKAGIFGAAKFHLSDGRKNYFNLMVYSDDFDLRKKAILELLGMGKEAFFVYDQDCGNLMALKKVFYELARKYSSKKPKHLERLQQTILNKLKDEKYCKNLGLNDVQRKTIIAALSKTDIAEAKYISLADSYMNNPASYLCEVLGYMFDPKKRRNGAQTLQKIGDDFITYKSIRLDKAPL